MPLKHVYTVPGRGQVATCTPSSASRIKVEVRAFHAATAGGRMVGFEAVNHSQGPVIIESWGIILPNAKQLVFPDSMVGFPKKIGQWEKFQLFTPLRFSSRGLREMGIQTAAACACSFPIPRGSGTRASGMQRPIRR